MGVMAVKQLIIKEQGTMARALPVVLANPWDSVSEARALFAQPVG
jgi:hypothetical protein